MVDDFGPAFGKIKATIDSRIRHSLRWNGVSEERQRRLAVRNGWEAVADGRASRAQDGIPQLMRIGAFTLL
jgi:hypothetical protein